jgi:hypothetical protein
MSLLIAATAVYGFSHTIDHNLIHRSPLPPFVLYIHAIVFPAWIVFFILQSALVRSHNVHLHRRLGWFGVGLAVAIIIVGTLTAISMARFEQKDPFNSAAFLIPSNGPFQLRRALCARHPLAQVARVSSAPGADRLLRAARRGHWPLFPNCRSSSRRPA